MEGTQTILGAVMPGSSFGKQAASFIRLSLTVPDEALRKAAARIIGLANGDARGEL